MDRTRTKQCNRRGDLLRELRWLLEQRRSALDIVATAKILGVSVRTLQRRLRAEETSFRREIVGARLRNARRLMLETTWPLSRIASEVGFTSPARFATAFRRIERVSPSEWRRLCSRHS